MPYRSHWTLDPGVVFLNHGSFGACPLPVLAEQSRWRERMEHEPVRFFVHEVESALDGAAGRVAEFVGARPADLVFVANATTGVNAVLRSLRLAAGDEILATDHGYNACVNTLRFVCERAGARAVVVPIPFPLAGSEQIVEAILDAVTPRTRLAMISHITSSTGLILPIKRLVDALAARGVDTLVDGAHAPGMVPLDLAALGAAYYTGNCHKWLCAPKGAAFLHVRADRQAGVRPAVISHGANSARTDRSRFRVEFGWTGTDDPSAFLSVPAAIDFMGSLLPGGWPALMAANRTRALAGRRAITGALGQELPAPDEMIGALAAVPLPAGTDSSRAAAFAMDPLQEVLMNRHRIEVPVFVWPAPPHRLLRISAQIYNHDDEYRLLAGTLRELLATSGT
ncbi:MAG: aminotransferase class V-fold PLP-dependent enzyme [Acidobacteriota bacterium]